MTIQAIFSCNDCGRERVSGNFAGHRSGMGTVTLQCLACDAKQVHTFERYESERAVSSGDMSRQSGSIPERSTKFPPESMPGETESLLAFEDLPESIQKAIQEKRKHNPMIELQERQVPTSSTPTPKGITFLKPQHASKEGTKATVYKATTDKPDNYGNPVVVYFLMNNQKYSKGFSLSSDNLRSLVGILGKDETKWAKKPVTIFCVEDEEKSLRLAFGK